MRSVRCLILEISASSKGTFIAAGGFICTKRAPKLGPVDIPCEVTFCGRAILFLEYLRARSSSQVKNTREFWKEAPERLFARRKRMEKYVAIDREDRRGIKIAETVKGRGNATDD